MRWFQKIASSYKTMAILLLNTVIIILFLNFASFFVLDIKRNYFKNQDLHTNPVAEKYGIPLSPVYPGMDDAEINALVNECWPAYQSYEPYTQIKEEVQTGKYVNVDKNGFRITKDQGPWPPAADKINIFLFGGSTTFGRGVPDYQTIASYLQELLCGDNPGKEYKIYNFGRGSYYSTPERILLQQLLISGFIPDLAIFIDGYNDFWFVKDKYGFAKQTAQIAKYIEEANKAHRQGLDNNKITWSKLWSFTESLPLVRVSLGAKNRIIRSGNKDFGNGKLSQNVSKVDYRDHSIISGVINRYLNNKKIIEAVCASYGVTPIFVWQPVPNYKYDLKYHLFANNQSRFKFEHYDKYGYPVMARRAKTGELGKNFLWCADLQERDTTPNYVDRCHYAARMSERLANTIHQMMLERGLLKTPNKKS